jgi:hypothetical protein
MTPTPQVDRPSPSSEESYQNKVGKEKREEMVNAV